MMCNPKAKYTAICMISVSKGPRIPSRYMVLSTIQLKQRFVGYLVKLGGHFIGFMESMHHTGCNTIMLSLLASNVLCNTMQSHLDVCFNILRIILAQDNDNVILLCTAQHYPSNHTSWKFDPLALTQDASDTLYDDESLPWQTRPPQGDNDDEDEPPPT